VTGDDRREGAVPLSKAGSIDSAAVAGLADERLDWRFKAVPSASWGATVAEYAAARPALPTLGTPLLTLDAGALDHNVMAMARWCAASGLDLAPHGKTTMAPALWARQLAAGAWGITLANLAQLRVARAFGVNRLQLANTLLDPAGLIWIAGELDRDPGFDFVSWVDSARSAELMDAALRTTGAGRPVDVCVELGGAGGRTGCRDSDEAVAVARAVVAAPTLRLVGTAGYEGALAHDASPDALAAVDRFLHRLADLHTRLAGDGLFGAADDVLVTAGGSAYFDQVAEALGPLAGPDVTVLLRSGAYVAHDDGFYRGISPLARRRGRAGTTFRAAIHGWARVVSRPEAGLALLDGGKRDFSFDEGLPEPQRVVGRIGSKALEGAKITALNDQHSFLALAADSVLDVGDVLRVGLSHPCTAFDKWTLIPVIDDSDAAEPAVLDLVRTFF
jgi:D-serine deaminase-like pyridoxal phosphate-dependent protein